MNDQERAKAAVEWLRGSDLDCRGVELCDSLIDLLRPIAAGTHVIVPIEPTEKMKKVGIDARWQSPVRDANNVSEIYRAMIEASQEGEK